MNPIGNNRHSMLLGTVRFMKKVGLLRVILLTCSHPCCAIYGPFLARADVLLAPRACQETDLTQGQEITKAMQSGNSAQVLRVLGDAQRECRATPAVSALYTVKVFCIHELVPSHLLPRLDPTKKRWPITALMQDVTQCHCWGQSEVAGR
jgi:hypothetical protein